LLGSVGYEAEVTAKGERHIWLETAVVDKSTVRRAVRSGRISGTRDEGGVWRVEPVELHRVFSPAVRTGATLRRCRFRPPRTP